MLWGSVVFLAVVVGVVWSGTVWGVLWEWVVVELGQDKVLIVRIVQLGQQTYQRDHTLP